MSSSGRLSDRPSLGFGTKNEELDFDDLDLSRVGEFDLGPSLIVRELTRYTDLLAFERFQVGKLREVVSVIENLRLYRCRLELHLARRGFPVNANDFSLIGIRKPAAKKLFVLNSGL
jgi:hypothetical protein